MFDPTLRSVNALRLRYVNFILAATVGACGGGWSCLFLFFYAVFSTNCIFVRYFMFTLDFLYFCIDVGLDCVSGWRLLDAPPYWAPKLGQETKKVAITAIVFVAADLTLCHLFHWSSRSRESYSPLLEAPGQTQMLVELIFKEHSKLSYEEIFFTFDL